MGSVVPPVRVDRGRQRGAWWRMLPASVQDKQSFMASLLYSLLIKPETFPPNSREIEAVEGSQANCGYNAIYNVLRLHHPLLDSVRSMANEIPRHRRNESFSLYLRRLQEFFARERIAQRVYTESEALDLAVSNLTNDWRPEFRRLIERDKRSGPGGSLPFKLALPQIATTFFEYANEIFEYANEIGRDTPGQANAGSRSNPTSILRRLETELEDDDDAPAPLPDEEVDLIVRAIAQNQASSSVCLGCQLPGHTLVDCNNSSITSSRSPLPSAIPRSAPRSQMCIPTFAAASIPLRFALRLRAQSAVFSNLCPPRILLRLHLHLTMPLPDRLLLLSTTTTRPIMATVSTPFTSRMTRRMRTSSPVSIR